MVVPLLNMCTLPSIAVQSWHIMGGALLSLTGAAPQPQQYRCYQCRTCKLSRLAIRICHSQSHTVTPEFTRPFENFLQARSAGCSINLWRWCIVESLQKRRIRIGSPSARRPDLNRASRWPMSPLCTWHLRRWFNQHDYTACLVLSIVAQSFPQSAEIGIGSPTLSKIVL